MKMFKQVSLWASVQLSSLPSLFNGIYEITVWEWTLVLWCSCPESVYSVPDGRSVIEVWFSSPVPVGSQPTFWGRMREEVEKDKSGCCLLLYLTMLLCSVLLSEDCIAFSLLFKGHENTFSHSASYYDRWAPVWQLSAKDRTVLVISHESFLHFWVLRNYSHWLFVYCTLPALWEKIWSNCIWSFSVK